MKDNKIFGNFIKVVLLLILLSGCDDSLKDQLIGKVDRDCGDNPDANCKIAINAVTKFKWDKMYLLANWTTQDSITKIIGFKYEGEDVPDQYSRMLFICDKKAVYEEDFETDGSNNPTIDFESGTDNVFEAKPFVLSISNTKFSVKKEKAEHCKDCFNYSFGYPIKQK